MDYAIDQETAEEAGDLILSMIEGLNGVNLQAVVAALEEVLDLARLQLE